MKISTNLLAASIIAFSPQLLHSAELGRVNLNGRQIIINDDNSWAYVTENSTASTAKAPEGCTEIPSKILPMKFCLDADKWALAEINDVAELQFKVKDQEIYAMIITETSLMPEKQLKEAILANGQNAAGLNKIEIIKDVKKSEVREDFPNFAYNANIDGALITYDNYYKTIPHKGIVQIIMFSGQSDYQNALPYMNEFIAGVTVTN